MSDETPRTEAGRRYVGVCYDSGGWGGDLTGHLVGEFEDGWKVAASHISSSEGWAEQDIRRHFDRREESADADTFEWAGRLTIDEVESRFGWASLRKPEQSSAPEGEL